MRMSWPDITESLVFAVCLLVCRGTSPGQTPPATDIPRDTSFTPYSAWKSIRGSYPGARLVEAEISDGPSPLQDIVYASVGGRDLHLDLFVPADSSVAHPVVVLIHGGGWRSGYRQMEWPMARRLAARGFAAATVEYRLSPEAPYPAAVHDIKAAIRWTRKHSRDHAIDPQRLALYGCSAGGHLAALVGVTSGIPLFDGEEGDTSYTTGVQAVVDIDGILDFTDPAESGKDTGSAPPSAGRSWLGASFKERPDLWREASPLNHVNETSPPIVFINSSLDRFHAGRDGMILKLNTFHVRSEVHTIPHTPHTFWLFHPWFEETVVYVQDFLDRTLGTGHQRQ